MTNDDITPDPCERSLQRFKRLLMNRAIIDSADTFYYNLLVSAFMGGIDNLDAPTRDSIQTQCLNLLSDLQLQEFDEWMTKEMAPRDYRYVCAFVCNFNDPVEVEQKESKLHPQFMRLHEIIRQQIQQRTS